MHSRLFLAAQDVLVTRELPARAEADMGSLKTGAVNFNDSEVAKSCKEALQEIASNESSYYELRFKPAYYFEVTGRQPPEEVGWYVILDRDVPLYVGRADNLCARLNSNQGSTDNFGKANRESDPERNFIKRFDELGMFSHLQVCVFCERQLLPSLPCGQGAVTDLDRANIEKLLNIFRSCIRFKA